MSLESWKAEFYPVDAKDVSEADALAHSLKKWEGLRKENLERHRGKHNEHRHIEFEDGIFMVNDGTCACCVHWDEDDDGCPGCPLSQDRGERCDGGDDAPYGKFTLEHNPEPMIQLIQLAIERQEKKS